MRPRPSRAGLAAAALTAIAWTGVAAPATAAATSTGATSAVATAAARQVERVCAPATAGFAACHAIRVDVGGVSPLVAGYGPADLQSAYNLPSATAGAGQTIAIVDAFDDPNAESDLAVYRSNFGLPACTTANGCFRKVDQNGGTHYPRTNVGWAQEISLDLDMASAICPNCHILLVEAKTNSFTNLGTAVNRAATMGAHAISNSYGGSDLPDSTYGASFNHPGIAVTASTGDSGFGVSYPASSTYVVAVGGTSLVRSGTSRGWSETAWSGAGSGCSAYNLAIPSASTFDTGCPLRAVADVSAVADPNTGVAVYDTFHTPGWVVFGGTSVSSPIIASVYGLAGNAGSIDANDYPYQHYSTTVLNDVTAGSNGSCSPSQLCTARVGWDGPTGLGTPNGTGAF